MSRSRRLTWVAGGLGALLVCLGPSLPASARASQASTPPPGPAAPVESSTSLDASLARLGPRDTLRVLVTMTDRTSLRGIPTDRGRARQLSAVVSRLKAASTATQASVRARLRVLEQQGEVSSVTPLWVTNAISLTATSVAVRELAARPDVAEVVPDGITITPVAVSAEPNLATVGAPDLWAEGQTGQGVVVASLDTGVDVTNPDLAASWRGGSNSWFDPYGEHPSSPVDLSGHGTATTGVIVGGDDAGTAYGMAPGARWIAARISDDRGVTSATAVHEAFQWLLDPDQDPATADAPQVVNGSWVLGSGPGCDLSFQPDVQALRAAGILPVFAAGNFGGYASTSASPANYPESLSVGAVDANDLVWYASSAGPSSCGGRSRVFPDLVAPGVSILSADRYGLYQYVSGTSIAAPHVSGAAALLLGAHPDLDVDGQQTALTTTAVDLGAVGPDDRYGHGRLDVVAANAWASAVRDFTVTASPDSQTVKRRESAAYSVDVGALGVFSGEVTLTASDLPKGATADWSVDPVLAPGSSTLTITTASKTRRGTYSVLVTGVSGTLTRTVTLTLVVR